MANTATQLHETLMKYGRLATFPVGVKLAKKGDQAPEKMRYPLKDLGSPTGRVPGNDRGPHPGLDHGF